MYLLSSISVCIYYLVQGKAVIPVLVSMIWSLEALMISRKQVINRTTTIIYDVEVDIGYEDYESS
jgi:hypothetical protein